ncbi:unnamed protein product [Rotaria sp. Silwood1]|nr:unnamed protein product [Rotaria sp. Silwood1]
MEQITPKTRSQLVRFHDTIVQIQTVVLNDIECLCLEDVQRRFPSATVLCIDNIQLAFLRDNNGHQLIPLRIEAINDQIIEAIEPIEKSNNQLNIYFDRIDTKIQEMNKKTDIILANTQETLIRIKHVMTQMYELHEYTTPRYFFILPVKHHNWTSINTIQNLFLLHYKLYFLCECSDEPDKLHIAPHDGYSIKKPSEFIANYGSYLRTTLNIARNLFSIGGFVIPQSENVSSVVANALPSFIKESNNYTDINNKLDLVEKMLNQTTHDELSRVDSSMIRKVVLPEISLQGAQLRELEAFLELIDNKHSLGNLYRTITNDGHVRWVCLEHYHTMSFNNKMSEYIRQLEAFGGKFNQETKEVILTGSLTTKNITIFCDALTKGFTILTLVLQNCSFNIKDLDKLFDVIINRSSIQRLIIMSVEVRKWMKMSKYICNYMAVSFKNQSLTVQFSNHQNEDIKIFIQLLQQNKICRTFNFFGYDLSIHNHDLLHSLKKNKELTTLIINHFMNIEFLNEIITSNYSPSRIKLSYCFNLSSTLYGLCQAIGQNETLIDLDIIDQTSMDDKAATIELLNVLRRHKSIKHVRLHIFDIQPSNKNEICLINTLLNDSFISHLRISESIISHQFIEALVYASKERHSLTYVEFYNSQLNEDDISTLQLLYTNESLTHLSICEQQYFSVAIKEMRQQLVNEFSQYQNSKLEQKIAQSYNYSSICLDNMDLVDQDMEIIVKQAIITKQCNFISLQFNKFTSIGISILADALNNNNNNNNTLEILYLGNNYISDDGIYFLANILSMNNHTLKTLVLQKNRITDKGVRYLAEMLKINQTLIWLYLGQNEISDEGIRILAQTIQYQNHTLEMLVLSNNKLLTDISIDYLIEMIKHNQSLKKLWIDNCNLSELGKERLNKIQQIKKDFYIRV